MGIGSEEPRVWMKPVLRLAGVYNIAWGGLAVFFPKAAFEWAGMPQPNYPELWQCVGMIVGVYGVGFLVAALNPLRHWPIVLVGLLGKILGPVGFLNAALSGRFPWALGWNIVTNDLIWWVPFTLILLAAYRNALDTRRIASPEVQKMALRARTQVGATLLDLSQESPILLVFLRHAGCTFCREALTDLAMQRRPIESTGTRLVLIHMGSNDGGGAGFFARYGLGDVARVSDPAKNIYRAFGLGRGGVGKLFGPKVWWRGFQAGVLHRHGFGRMVGDGFQMPGVYLVFHGEVVRGYRHQSAADRPDYLALAKLDPTCVA